MPPFDVHALLRPEVWPHPTETIRLVETHISWVILTGELAYKIKKPVNFGFLDFSTLEKRRYYCEQEIRLNRRLAEDIYLQVVAVVAAGDSLRVVAPDNAKGEVMEYAVQMKQFDQAAQLDEMLARGRLGSEHMQAIGNMVAEFHQRIAVAGSELAFGSSEAVYHPVAENFQQIGQNLPSPYRQENGRDKTLERLQQWSEASFRQLEDVFKQRKADGFVRECHGDMHLRNLMWWPAGEAGRPQAFDCIEFNDSLRWIDVISEVAFLVMDLQDRKQPGLASVFLNSYLENTGDYAGLRVLPFYLCYRAMVRAKVSVLRLAQAGISAEEKQALLDEFDAYLQLAAAYSRSQKPQLILMRGLSASGKSTVSSQLLEHTGAIRIRSDVERKRLFAADSGLQEDSGINTGLYAPEISEKTYQRLLDLASTIITAGYRVIVDAAFLKPQQRQLFIDLARERGADCRIVETTAPADTLRRRIAQRKHDVSDADLAVLEYQLKAYRPLSEPEKPFSYCVDTAADIDFAALLRWLDKETGD